VTICGADSWRSIRWFVGWSVATLLVSLLIFPHWVFEWRAIVGAATRVRPYAVRAGGFLLLLALFRYRRPEARWLAALVFVPTTASSPDALVLFAFPHSFRQGLVLALLTHAINFYVVTQPKPPTDDAVTALNSGVTLVLAFLPALLVVLSRKNRWPSE
jgi:hypothetical protein